MVAALSAHHTRTGPCRRPTISSDIGEQKQRRLPQMILHTWQWRTDLALSGTGHISAAVDTTQSREPRQQGAFLHPYRAPAAQLGIVSHANW